MKIVLIAGAATVLAGAAGAQPLHLRLPDLAHGPSATAQVHFAGEAPRPVPDLADPLDPQAPTKLQAHPLDSAVFAKTTLDHRFSSRDDVTGSVGFLCGLQPGHTESGAAAAYGSDPHGRFVGAKFSIAFR